MKRIFDFSVAACISRMLRRPGAARPGLAKPPLREVVVVNLSRSDVDVVHRGDGTVTITIKPTIRCEGVEFGDGSSGIEWGPEDGSSVQRRVEWPRGGIEAALHAPESDWSECDAARWVAANRPGWSVKYEVVADEEGFWPIGAVPLRLDERPIAGEVVVP